MSTPRVALITGGAGFIGRRVARALALQGWRLVVVDALTYAAHPKALAEMVAEAEAQGPRESTPQSASHSTPQSASHSTPQSAPSITLEHGDVADGAWLDAVFARWSPTVVLHLAAETHVDRALLDAAPFLRTNVLGTQAVVRSCVRHGVERLVHVSTDEVYGDREGRGATVEGDPVAPTNAYAASKACGDQLVLAAVRAEGLNAVVTRGVNTYGPGQFPEKLLPLAARRWAQGEPMALYGDGLQRRQWLAVDDHAAGVVAALHAGERGAVLHFAGESLTNREVLRRWAAALGHPWSEALLAPVADRPGHDRGYALDDAATRAALGWSGGSTADFTELAAWTHAHPQFWSEHLGRSEVQDYFARQYGQGSTPGQTMAATGAEDRPREPAQTRERALGGEGTDP